MKIAFLDTVHSILHEGLTEAGHDCIDLSTSSLRDIELSISTYDGIIIRSRFPLNKEFLSLAKNLKFIARSGAGLENIDALYCEQNSIQLFAAPEGNRNAVAEHALGMLLSLFNNLSTADAEVRSGQWNREGNRGVELEGKVVGIIGFGNNGSSFAQKLTGFDVEIIAYDKFKSGFGSERIAESSLEAIYECADVVSLHIPQNAETIGMIDASFIQKMEKSFYLINLSRGKIVNTTDLLAGIESKKVLGACLDVLEYETASFEDMFSDECLPESFSKLLKSKNVILSPHVGGWTRESYYKLSTVLLEKIIAHF